MDESINVIKRDPQVRKEINDMSDRYIRLPYNYQSKIGFDILSHNVNLKEIINLMGATIVDIDIQIKMKISRIKYLETRVLQCVLI